MPRSRRPRSERADPARELLLWRHAKAVPADAHSDDFDRPLNARGHRDAARVARWLETRAPIGLVLCSPSRRTRETLDAFAARLPRDCERHYERALYLAEPEQLLDELRGGPERILRVLLIGHNPGVHQLAWRLASESARRAPGGIGEAFPTSALAHFRLAGRAWSELDDGAAELVDFVRGRDLPGAEGES